MTGQAFTSRRIIGMLADRRNGLLPAVKAITTHASIPNLLTALKNTTNSRIRQILCDILGNRHDASALPLLLVMLDDKHSGVRAAAADAIAKIGSDEAGPILLNRFQAESDDGVRQMIAAALGAVNYLPSIPLLLEALKDQSEVLRGCAAWSLGHMKAREALEPLTRALRKEPGEYAANRMTTAIQELE